MKKFASYSKKIISILLSMCMLFLMTACVAGGSHDDNQLAQAADYKKYMEDEMGVKIVEDADKVSYIYSKDDCTMEYDTVNGTFCYTDVNGTYPLEITDINDDGVVFWRIAKDSVPLEGEANISEAPSAQTSIAIGGTGYLVYTFIYCVFKAAVIVTVAGTTCYLAAAAADAIKKNSKKYNYYPAYNVANNVYVATKKGLTKSKAVSRIRNGSNVWATSATYAYEACVSASPIKAAEWGWHGNRKTSSGYYPHYHAVKRYKSNGSYVHTGAHCWYI